MKFTDCAQKLQHKYKIEVPVQYWEGSWVDSMNTVQHRQASVQGRAH